MIELIAGGARSGKSRYALQRAEDSGLKLHFVATAVGGDDEMMVRIQKHQQERGEQWQLIEEPLHLAATLDQFAADDCVLIDCLTLWVSNWLCRQQEAEWQAEKQAFLTALQSTSATVFLVSNETGLGIVPTDKLSRQFIDESGWLHQQLAQLSDRVSLLVFGLPQILKNNESKAQ